MAQEYTKATGMAMPIAFTRTNPRPLDESSFFSSLEAAQTYAANGATAYVGQLLTVVTASGVDLYKITAADGTMEKVPDEARITELTTAIAAGLANTGFQGTISDCLADDDFVFKRGMFFQVDADAVTNIFSQFTPLVETGDFLIWKSATESTSSDVSGFLGSGQAATFLDRMFSIWQANLTGAVTSVTGGAAETAKYISAVTKNGNTLEFSKSVLPVRAVSVVGTGNNIIGASFDHSNGTLTLTKGTVNMPRLQRLKCDLQADMNTTRRTAFLAGEQPYPLSQTIVGQVTMYVNGVLAPESWYSVSDGSLTLNTEDSTDGSAVDIADTDVLDFVFTDYAQE